MGYFRNTHILIYINTHEFSNLIIIRHLNMSIKISKDLIPGGLADNIKSNFDPDQISKGINVEMEHTNNPSLAKEIAQDHLTEDPKYYDHLEEMESKYSKTYTFASLYFDFVKFDHV